MAVDVGYDPTRVADERRPAVGRLREEPLTHSRGTCSWYAPESAATPREPLPLAASPTSRQPAEGRIGGHGLMVVVNLTSGLARPDVRPYQATPARHHLVHRHGSVAGIRAAGRAESNQSRNATVRPTSRCNALGARLTGGLPAARGDPGRNNRKGSIDACTSNHARANRAGRNSVRARRRPGPRRASRGGLHAHQRDHRQRRRRVRPRPPTARSRPRAPCRRAAPEPAAVWARRARSS